jgi:hypothetical protein
VIFNNKKKRVAGAGQKREYSTNKALVQSEALFIESTSESEEYVDKEEDNAEEEEAYEEQHEELDAVQDSSGSIPSVHKTAFMFCYRAHYY